MRRMRILTLSFLALAVTACGGSPTPTNQPDADAVADTDSGGGDVATDGGGDGDAAADADAGGDADATPDTPDGTDAVADADATPDTPDALDATDTEVIEEVVDCTKLANACTKANEKRCAPSGPVAAQQCVLKSGCLQWLDAEICEENNLCTGKPDLCVDGACQPDGDPDASCDTPTAECTANLCDAATGNCQLQTGGDFEACDDNNACTDSDLCFDGGCTGELSCPKACNLDAISCNGLKNLTLSIGGTTVMNAYGCDGAGEGYGGAEQAMQISNKSGSECGDFQVSIELADPKKAGTAYADVMLLDKKQGICWPDDCKAAGFMDASGRGLLETNLAAGTDYIVVVDGRETFSGDVRVVANCCGGNPRELFCSNNEDDDGDGLTDCDDPDCSDDPAGGVAKICTFEHACHDGADNDGDGLKDCADPDCAKAPACTLEASCEDGLDDDGDGLTDCADPACDGSLSCGGGCPDATTLECGQALTGLTMDADGVSTFSNTPIPTGCGGVTEDTPYTAKHGLFLASAPTGCSAKVVIDFVDSSTIVDAFVFGPGCSVDACKSGEIFASHFELPVTTAPNWIMVADFTNGAFTKAEYDVELQCVCP